jgi:hypothetical protein
MNMTVEAGVLTRGLLVGDPVMAQKSMGTAGVLARLGQVILV